ncbi:gliding motility-associated C-terminal domain-containing protein [Hymenobacter sp. YC55]|uniref:gliding motility-associated C-terminal domain-containing protein n=1 Tax=Hymenobacter sp. YC55 TaxID=3034019 RepID=UPI0023F7508F|nr:gliding motility-associated C-terminal domain-containing protein [Hymenobacter sp. YC55]
MLLLLSGAAATVLAQGTPPPECSADEKFANTWYFGFKAGLDFNQASADSLPKVLTNGAMDAPAGSGVMSDRNGKILFYSNGETVWNGDGTVMTNGTGLAGSRFTTDGPLPIRMPGIPPAGQPTRYLLFTLKDTVGLSYSEIEIPAGGGPGTVIAATKNTPLARGTAEKITGVFHKNGCDIWVITHGWGAAKAGNNNRGNAFLAYRVRQAAGYVGPVVIDAPILSTVGSLHAPNVAAQGYKGQMKVTPDGQRLALARYSEAVGDSSSTVELFGFDNNTGNVSVNMGVPYIVDSGAGKYYGVSFSPGSYLYATVRNPAKLLQFDISDPGPITKQDIPLKQKAPADLGSMQAAPDGKIYVARDNQPALGFIPFPDSLGAKVGYADDSLQLGGRLSGLGLVNFNQSSLLQFGPNYRSTACLEITFEAPSVNFEDPKYAWTYATTTGATLGTSTLQNPVFAFPAPGDYVVTLRVTTSCFCRESQGLIRVPGPPTPGSLGPNQNLCVGGTPAPITGTSAGGGLGPDSYAYQWQSSPDDSNWTDIPGATGASYTPTVTTNTYFRRLVTSGFCGPRTPSNSVQVIFLPTVTPTVALAAPPAQCPGTPLTFTAVPTDAGAIPTFQWFVNNVAVAATGPTFTSSTVVTGDQVRVVVTPAAGVCSTGTATATVTVTRTVAPAPTLTIAAQPAGPVCLGASITFNVASVTDAGPVSDYQWQVDGTDVPGATGPTFTSTTLLQGQTVTARLRTTDVCGQPAAVVSNGIPVQIQAPVTPTVALAAPPAQCPGTPLTFTAVPTDAGATPTFQWFVNNVAVAATGPTFTSSTVVTGDQVRVEVTPTAGLCSTGIATTTTTVTRTVPSPQPTLTIAVQPNGPVCPGAPLSFTIASVTEAGPTPEYQWQINGADVAGATGSTFTSITLLQGQVVTLRLRTANTCGQPVTAVSNGVAAQILPLVTPTVSLATPPVSCPGTPLTFTAAPANAGAAPSFRWLVNNVAVATGPTFTSSTLATGDQVSVEVTPTVGLCSTGLAVATVTVARTPALAPTLTITVQPSGTVCLGAPLTFNVSSVTEAGPAPEYQWQVNGTDVAGATGPTFTSTTLREGQTVTARLRTANVCGQTATAASNGIAVRIQGPVDVDAGPDKEILAGTSVTLEGRANGIYPVTWTPTTGLTFPGNNPLRPVVSPTVTTTYTLTGGEGGCADSDQVTVVVRPPIRIPNAFTPNGDGRDDTWQIEFIEQFPDNTVTVFNRWGNKIFSANNYSRANEWRGDINGQPAPVGTYYYVVVTKGPLGKSYSGSITILY